MGVRVTTTFNPERFLKASVEAVNAGLTNAALAGAKFMKEGMSTTGRYTSSSPGSPPNVRRNGLRGSIHHTKSTAFVASAGSNLPYALIQEKGGVIRPKRGKFIPVPLNIPAMRQMEKFGGATATEFFAGAGGSTGYISTFNGGIRRLDLHVEKSKNGTLFLVGKRPVRVRWVIGDMRLTDKSIPRWILKRQVRLPARPWCMVAVTKNRPAIMQHAALSASAVFVKAGFGPVGAA